MKPFWKSKTFWVNLATLPVTALLTPILGAEDALKVGIVANTLGNLVLRLFYTDTALTTGEAPVVD